MNIVFRQVPLYRFLQYCNESNHERTVLDCGAGGNCPPLALFLQYEYRVAGIEIDKTQIEKANIFAKNHGIELNIQYGDMKRLDYEDESFCFVYSYNSIFHMKKSDIEKSLQEMKRVLIPDGLLFVNLLSTSDEGFGSGKELGVGEYEQIEEDETCIHTYYEINEADRYFDGMEILWKEVRLQEILIEGRKIKQGYIDYIVKK